MESVFKIIMGVLFDAAILLLFFRLTKQEGEKKDKYRFVFGSFAAGFMFAAAEEFAVSESPVAFALYVFGFIVSSDIFASTFLKKSEKNESC